MQRLIGHQNSVHAITADFGLSACVSTSLDNTAKVWDLVSGECLQTFEEHTEIVVACDANWRRGEVATGGWNFDVKIWDPMTGECKQTLLGHRRMIVSVALSP